MGRGQQYESGSHSAQFQFHGAHTGDHPVYFWQGSRLKAKCWSQEMRGEGCTGWQQVSEASHHRQSIC